MAMLQPTAASALRVDAHAWRPSRRRVCSPRYTPSTNPRNSPTMGTTKKPTIPRTAPSANVRPGTPASFSRLPGNRYLTTEPTTTIAMAMPNVVHANGSPRGTAQAAMPTTTSSSPGSTGTTTPTSPTTISTAATTIDTFTRASCPHHGPRVG